MKGTVKSVKETESGVLSAVISRTDPLPAVDEAIGPLERWVFKLLVAAKTGKDPVELGKDPADGHIKTVEIK